MTSKQIYIFILLLGLVVAVLLSLYTSIHVTAETTDSVLYEDERVTPVAIHPFIQAFSQSQNGILIDIRTPEEFQSGHIQGAINVDFYDPLFLQNIQQVANGRPVFMYCRSGNRSSSAYRQLIGIGLDVIEMRGGILSYTGALVQD